MSTLLSILALSFVWLVGGALLGLLVRAARLFPSRSAGTRYSMRRAASVGALAALVGGWLGALIFGRPFASAAAVWVCALVVELAPVLGPRLRGLPFVQRWTAR